MRITDEVLIVGSGKLGFELSDSVDCNVYLIDGGDDYALVDAGGGVNPDRIVSNIERCGVPIEKVTKLLLTHVHADHAAGAHFFREQYGMKVVCHADAAPWLENADMDRTSLAVAIQGGVYPQGFLYPPCAVDVRVREGDTVNVGNIVLNVIETPGHSRGHVSFSWRANGRLSLFSGDSIFARGRIVTQYIWDCSIQEYAATIIKLDQLEVDVLYPGHGTFLLGQAHVHVHAAAEAFARLDIPPNL